MASELLAICPAKETIYQIATDVVSTLANSTATVAQAVFDNIRANDGMTAIAATAIGIATAATIAGVRMIQNSKKQAKKPTGSAAAQHKTELQEAVKKMHATLAQGKYVPEVVKHDPIDHENLYKQAIINKELSLIKRFVEILPKTTREKNQCELLREAISQKNIKMLDDLSEFTSASACKEAYQDLIGTSEIESLYIQAIDSHYNNVVFNIVSLRDEGYFINYYSNYDAATILTEEQRAELLINAASNNWAGAVGAILEKERTLPNAVKISKEAITEAMNATSNHLISLRLRAYRF